MTPRILRSLLVVSFLAAAALLNGCAIVCYHTAQYENTKVIEAGFIGLPASAQNEAVTAGLLPFYRETEITRRAGKPQ